MQEGAELRGGLPAAGEHDGGEPASVAGPRWLDLARRGRAEGGAARRTLPSLVEKQFDDAVKT